jgi:hypothetical protein
MPRRLLPVAPRMRSCLPSQRTGVARSGSRCAGCRTGIGRSARPGWRRFDRRALGDDLAAVHAGAGAEVDHMVGGADGVLVVLDDDHGVAEVAQMGQRASRRSLSRWCRPMEGSSRMYITPTSPAPIWLARRMRWASPPDRVSALRVQGQVVQPDVDQEAQPLGDLLMTLAAISPAGRSGSQRVEPAQAVAHRQRGEARPGHDRRPARCAPPFSRVPSQAGQGRVEM